jgi:hypothetical protein
MIKTEQEKWDFIIELEETLLQGGVILSEWSSFLVRDAMTAWCSGANLAAILSAQAAVESHLRYEYFGPEKSKGCGLFKMLQEAPLEEDVSNSLDKLRRFRNQWVHVNDPSNDQDLLKRPEYHESEIEEMAKLAIESMMRVLYTEQWL